MRQRGFTLIEVVFTVALLAVGALLLSASLASSQRMQALAREREQASNAIRAYLERMREKYPTAQNSTDMSGYLSDATTPLDYLNATSRYEKNLLRNSAARVLKATHEDGTNWGPGVTTSNTIFPVASAMSASDRASLGLPRQLDTDASDTQTPVPNNELVYIPVRIDVSWASGSSDTNTTQRQGMTVHAVIGPQH
ncbi:MAG: prepilin-type N-terminal cleavage/methylation domain-containing protein [Planctomycetota bacterium]